MKFLPKKNNFVGSKGKPVARPVKTVLEESRGTFSKSIFHTICYYNQMDNACARKD